MNTFFTSESVTEGHPDKVCDQIADAILDALLEKDPHSHVACEVTAITDAVHIFGEITSAARVDYEAIARQVIREIGYTKSGHGFDADSCRITVDLHEQSPDINMGVEKADAMENGAGDQGMMFGYACDETAELMPAPLALSHALARRLTAVRKSGELNWLRPDGKSQVTVEYDAAGNVLRCPAIVVSTQHSPDIAIEELREAVIDTVVKPVIPEKYIDRDTKFYINPTGRFVIGGPVGDSGLTGRKIIVDTYGGSASHGGGCFSGKDPTKVDRSAAYAARYVAKNIVAAGLARRCQVQLAYAIGVAQPVSVLVDTFGTGTVGDDRLETAVRKVFDLRPTAIIRDLDLRKPIYRKLAAYGHMGREDLGVTWEKTDRTEALKAAAEA